MGASRCRPVSSAAACARPCGGYHRAMTEELFRADGYLRECTACVLRIDEAGGIVLDRTVFYPLGGGQAGDSGVLLLADGRELAIADSRKAKDAEGRATGEILHLPAAGQQALLAALAPGAPVTARIDWARRHRLMRFHTATHLLCHLVARPVNGCSITPDYCAARLPHDGAARQGRADGRPGAAGGRGPPAGRRQRDRCRARRQPGPRQKHERAAAARQRHRADHPHRPQATEIPRSTCSLAAAPTSPTRPRSAPSSSPRSRRRAPPPAGWCWPGAIHERRCVLPDDVHNRAGLARGPSGYVAEATAVRASATVIRSVRA